MRAENRGAKNRKIFKRTPQKITKKNIIHNGRKIREKYGLVNQQIVEDHLLNSKTQLNSAELNNFVDE